MFLKGHIVMDLGVCRDWEQLQERNKGRVDAFHIDHAQRSKFDGVQESSMSYAAWKCMMSYSQSSTVENTHMELSERFSSFVSTWDRKVQVFKLDKSKLKVVIK